MGYGQFDQYEEGPYGAVIPAGGLPPEYFGGSVEYVDASEEPEPETGGLPPEVLKSLELPGRAEKPEYAAAVEAIAPKNPAAPAVPAHDVIEGFRLELPRGNWVQFGSVLDVSGGLRRRIATAINVLAKRAQDGKATAHEMMAVDNEVTAQLLAVIVESWSFDAPLPVTPRTLNDLPGLVVDRISNVAAEYMKMLISQPGGNSGSETDPASPQRPSVG